LTWIFNAQDTTATNSAALRISPLLLVFAGVTFVDGFPAVALPDRLSKHGLISAEGRLSEAFGCCSVEAF